MGFIKKKLNIIIATILVVNSILSINNIANAAYIDTVMYRWDEVTSYVNGWYKNVTTTNKLYKDITFRNGYTYTTSNKDISSWFDMISNSTRIRYTRTFRTY